MPLKLDVLVLRRDPTSVLTDDRKRAGDGPYTAICLTRLPGGLDPTTGWSHDEAVDKMRTQAREVLRHYRSYSVETVDV